MKYDRLIIVAALAAIPAVALAQNPANVTSGISGKHLQRSDDVQLPASVWHDSLWIVDTDVVDSGNGSAISGMSIFGVVYDLSLVDDFVSPGGNCTKVVHDYLNFNGGGYAPATDYLVEFFSDASGAPANTASTVLTGTSYAASAISVYWWGPCTRITSNISASTPAGPNWVSPSPVDLNSSGDWYYGCRKYGTGIGADAYGRDGGAMHGSLYGGPYGGGYGVSTWTSMGALGFTAGDWSCQVSGGSGSGFNLVIDNGICDISFDVTITGGVPGAKCAFAYANNNTGSTPVPPCSGLYVDMSGANAWVNYPSNVVYVYLNGSGNFFFTKKGGPKFCGMYVQVVDLTNCAKSNVVAVP